MNMKLKVTLVTLAFAALGFALQPAGPIGSAIWPAHATATSPEGGILAGFIAYGLVEAVAFGLGFAFLFFGLPLIRNATPAAKGLATAAGVGIAFMLISWVPHDSLHQHIGENWAALLGLEWGFHFVLQAIGLVLAWWFVTLLRERATPAEAAAPTRREAAPVQK